MSRISFKRIGALWVLLCWTWFSTAAPFAHTCSQNSGKASAAISAGTSCISCDWQAVEKTAHVTPTPVVVVFQSVPQEFIESRSRAAQAEPLRLPARAPPA